MRRHEITFTESFQQNIRWIFGYAVRLKISRGGYINSTLYFLLLCADKYHAVSGFEMIHLDFERVGLTVITEICAFFFGPRITILPKIIPRPLTIRNSFW